MPVETVIIGAGQAGLALSRTLTAVAARAGQARHPLWGMYNGEYGEDQRAWWGPPHAALVDEFANPGDGYGFLIEATQYTTGLAASATPFTTAEEHKRSLLELRRSATTIRRFLVFRARMLAIFSASASTITTQKLSC